MPNRVIFSPAPIVTKVRGRVVAYSPNKRSKWQKVGIALWLIFFVIIPVLAGIVELVKRG